MLELVCYTRWDQLPASAEGLFSRGATDSLFFSRRWLENLTANALGDDQQLLLACVVERQRVHAILPLWTRPDRSWHALSNHFTSLFTLLLSADQQQRTLACLVEGLARLPFDYLRLEPVAQDDQALERLRQAMEAVGFESHRLFRFVNWSHPCDGQSFAQYLADRPSRVRNTIARKRRKLQREHSWEMRLHTDQGLDQALADYNAVYRASWKAGERFTDFVPALVSTMAEAGWLRLAVLYIDGRPAAGQIWLVVHGKASIFRLAYDEAWQAYSPGSILTAYLMEHVIDTDKVASIDFLTGNEHYKQDWMSERRERSALVFVRNQASRDRTVSLTRLAEWLRGAFWPGVRPSLKRCAEFDRRLPVVRWS